MDTNKIIVNDVIDNASFNKYFLLIFCILYSSFIVSGFALGAYSVTLSSIRLDFSLSEAQSGFLASSALFGMMVGALFLGMISDHIGRKITLWSAIAIFSVSNGLVGFVGSYWVFALLRFIAGVGVGALTPLCVSLLSEFSPKSRRTFLITLLMTGMPLGQLLVAASGIVFLDLFGWRFIYLLSFLGLSILPLVSVHLPESMKFYIASHKIDKITNFLAKATTFVSSPDYSYDINAINKEKTSIITLFTGKYIRNSIALSLVFFCNMYVFYGVSTWLPALMSNQGHTIVSGLAFLSIFLLGNILTAPAIGYFVDKFGYKSLMSIFYVIMAIVIVLFSFRLVEHAQFIFVFLIGGCIGVGQNTVLAIIPQFYTVAQRGTAIGAFSACSRVGSFIAPAVVGVMLSNNFGINFVFLFFAIPAVIGLLAILNIGNRPS